jgi:hypothetical protein
MIISLLRYSNFSFLNRLRFLYYFVKAKEGRKAFLLIWIKDDYA